MAKSTRTGNEYLSLLINTPDAEADAAALQWCADLWCDSWGDMPTDDWRKAYLVYDWGGI